MIFLHLHLTDRLELIEMLLFSRGWIRILLFLDVFELIRTGKSSDRIYRLVHLDWLIL